MAQFETWLKSDLKKPVEVVKLKGNLFSADNGGNLIGVEVMDDGSPATLSGEVHGYAIREDNYTVFIEGTLANNKASIILPLACYSVVGQISIVIKVGETTVGACTGYVYRSTTDAVVDPAHVIPSIEELLEQIDACIEATDDANEVAEKIDNMTVAANGLTYNANPTVTITEVSGHKHIAFGIPAGTPATIKSQTNYFQNSTSGTVIPTGEWSPTQPTTPQGSFLWVKHHIVWYDDTETDVYSVSRQGVDGSGSVSSILLGSTQLSPDGSGQITLPLDSTPTADSTNLVLSGPIQTQLAGLSARIDALDPDKGVGIFADFSLSIPSNAWTLSNNLYTYDYTNIAITQRAGVEVFYDTSYRTALAGDIYYTKNTGSITFTTTKAPVGTLTGTVRVIDSVQGVVPVDHGGTGANTASDAREALDIYASTVEMSSSDSTTIGSAINTLNNKIANVINVGAFTASGSGVETKITDSIAKVTTGGATVSFTANPSSSGVAYVSGFLYPNKDYGGGYYIDIYREAYWYLSNGTLSVTDLTNNLNNIKFNAWVRASGGQDVINDCSAFVLYGSRNSSDQTTNRFCYYGFNQGNALRGGFIYGSDASWLGLSYDSSNNKLTLTNNSNTYCNYMIFYVKSYW